MEEIWYATLSSQCQQQLRSCWTHKYCRAGLSSVYSVHVHMRPPATLDAPPLGKRENCHAKVCHWGKRSLVFTMKKICGGSTKKS